ncbi:sigma-54 interaction domain-containing protein [Desulfosediminicola flagellatus]|uniref:sigma-54 interaction domain-containing protein n=1 Tax=Desulfosediminicola flagellatus TaxID=2569541 RepID=UPI0010AC3376|nr:sigma 54-interacting transcriptional regulator [Desulfosediminicola flagellatus]
MDNDRQADLPEEKATVEKELLQLKKTNRDLLKRLEQMSCLLNNLPGMAFRCLYDTQLTIEYASEGSKTILGYDPDQIVSGLAFRQMVHKDDQAHNKEVVSSLTPENNRYNLIYRMQDAFGDNRWIHEQGIAIYSDDGQPVAIEGLLTDITEQKNREIKLHAENYRLRSSIKERYRLGQLIGKSQAMQNIYERIVKAADTEASVIINGESGTGKELAARAIHELSERRNKPFVAVNCGAISEALLESEFFGHLRGSFSGAYSDRDGFLMAANGGTLFLDEIGEMPLQLQVKLLRALDGRGFTPVGDNKILSSDFKLISASNRDLAQMVRQGKMREDFYYRINTVPIVMPPLHERKEDLPLLIEHFVNSYTVEEVELSSDFYRQLNQHNWPGNVRELQNVIRRYLTLNEVSFSPLTDQTSAEPNEVPAYIDSLSTSQGVTAELVEVERKIVLLALQENRWNMGQTATALGISRRTLQRRVNKHNLK